MTTEGQRLKALLEQIWNDDECRAPRHLLLWHNGADDRGVPLGYRLDPFGLQGVKFCRGWHVDGKRRQPRRRK